MYQQACVLIIPDGSRRSRSKAPPVARPELILDNIERVIIGKRPVLEVVLAAMLAGGHVLIEDVPGVAKTQLARALARSFRMSFARVQLTPDLLPADLTGTAIWNEQTRKFEFQEGPVFHQIVLVDELNRATPRTQAGLLEAMEERRVSESGHSHDLPRPFFVIATQNPLEQQGVFPLPEAQLDRFLVQVAMGYPGPEEELEIVRARATGQPIDRLESVASAEDFDAMARQAAAMHTDDSVLEYIVRLVRATRLREEVMLGASPRASIGIHHLARALAYVAGARHVLPDHVKRAAPHVLRHRMILTPQARLAGSETPQVIERLIEETEAPIHARP